MLSGYHPQRTLHFIAYAAEEVGLKGSQVIAQDFRARQVQVEAVLQFDMTGFLGDPEKRMIFINDFVNSDLTKWTENLVDTYLRIKWGESECGYACSDHASWDKFEYRSVFPFEATFDTHNKKIHTSADTIEDGKLDFEFVTQFAKLGMAFVFELAQD